MTAIVSANMLATGRVAYLGAEGAWVEDIAAATVYGDAAAAEAALAAAQRRGGGRLVVDPFVTGYTRADHDTLPQGRPTMTLRDAIRAHGPTVGYGRHGGHKPAGQDDATPHPTVPAGEGHTGREPSGQAH